MKRGKEREKNQELTKNNANIRKKSTNKTRLKAVKQSNTNKNRMTMGERGRGREKETCFLPVSRVLLRILKMIFSLKEREGERERGKNK